jgi:hypothetical protein
LKLNKIIYGVVIFILNFNLYSQEVRKSGDYYFPVMPKENNYLSGTMGELRSGHFHAGIDIGTSGRSGLPVYATMDGYVSRISVTTGGYGHALYIQHPNGETSVYGHLLRFREDIARYVLEQQYNKHTFSIGLFPEKGMFNIKKGDLIALSGNTGSSQAPHLHFEIRDENQRPLNPLKKGFSELNDIVPPSVYAIALRTMDSDSRVDNEFGRFEYAVKNKGDAYLYDDPVEVYGKIGLQIKAYDKFNRTSYRYGVPYISVYLDDNKIFEVQIDSFSFSDTRHIVNYYDYAARKNNNGFFQKMYLDEGNDLPFYPYHKNKGIINIRDDQPHIIKVKLKDVYGNVSSLTIPLQGVVPQKQVDRLKDNSSDQVRTTLYERFLKITAPFNDSTLENCILYSNRMRYELAPAYHSNKLGVYIWDMNVGLPDSVKIGDNSKTMNYTVRLPSGADFNYYNKVFDLKSYRRTLYDTLFLETSYELFPDIHSEIFRIGNQQTPLANPLQITFKPRLDYSGSNKYAVYSTSDFKNFAFEGNNWKDRKITVTTKNLGAFTILEDTLGPAIHPIQLNRRRISFRINDNLSGIKKIEAYLNDEWLLMNYDPKRQYIWSETLEPNKQLTGAFKLTVEDNVGNINEFTRQIN